MDAASDAASQKIQDQSNPSSGDYVNSMDAASDAASQKIQDQKDPSSGDYVNSMDAASDAATAANAAYDPGAILDTNTQKGLSAAKAAAANTPNKPVVLPDWRAKLSLAPSADYLYMAPNPGILAPLKDTKGIVFPYTPAIQVAYSAHYDTTTLTHSNYKIFQYGSSSVDSISVTCDFTAQDTREANYLLAVIHFLRTATKMFYGQDNSPIAGTPPPLCYFTGFGAFQFDGHPLAITSFNYSLPTDVDYISAKAGDFAGGVGAEAVAQRADVWSPSTDRVASNGLASKDPVWARYPVAASPTYVPTKMQIQFTAIPIVSRNDISNKFSVREYANGSLLQGSTRNNRGGIW